jgi:hypothetical protein
MRVGLVGGTGSFGRALGQRLVAAGVDEVVIGSRNRGRAETAAAELGGGTAGTTNEEAVRGVELAVLTVDASAALDCARSVADPLGGTPLLSVASAIRFERGVGMLPDPDALSLAERVQELVAGPVVAGFHSIAASNLGEEPADEDVLICGDDEDAKSLVLELATRVVAGRPLDAGPLASARALEGLTAVIVNLNRRYRGHAGIRVSGL